MIPVYILQMWFLAVLSLGILGGAVYAAREWQERSWAWDPVRQQSVFAPHWGWNEDTAMFALAAGLLFVTLFGGTLVKGLVRLMRRGSTAADQSLPPQPASTHDLARPDGTRLHVECFGPEKGIPIVLNHGWTMDGTEWKYLLQSLAGRYRLIVWDQPGLGRSTRPANRDYSLEKMAADLNAVLGLANDRPVILLGHSIGGMIILTFCRLFGGDLDQRVMGLVLTHTTPTDPVKTTSGAAFYTAIEKPVLVPLMYVTIALSPLVWLMNWLSYRNGAAHLSTMMGSYAGTETWGQVDFAARFMAKCSPAVIARGMLGMMHYDASKALTEIPVPALVVAADRDTTTKPEASEWIAAALPNSQRATLTPAKHLGLIEHHAPYAAAVETFVKQCAAEHAREYETTAAGRAGMGPGAGMNMRMDGVAMTGQRA